jgi:hypothetical protein
MKKWIPPRDCPKRRARRDISDDALAGQPIDDCHEEKDFDHSDRRRGNLEPERDSCKRRTVERQAENGWSGGWRLNPLDQIAIPFTLFGMAAAGFLLGRRSFCARVRLRGADRESLVGHARLRWTEDGPNSDAQ